MYKFSSNQIGMEDFGMPSGVKLSSENRWVKKAKHIPWDEIEKKYAALFKSGTGNVAKPLRLALGALIISTERGTSDVETARQIQETPCLQYFCGLPTYEDKLPFDPSLMVHFRKRLTAEILGEINEMIIAKNKIEEPSDSDDENNPNNKGTLIVDATCAPQNIRYPQDTSLLNEARENLEDMIDELHEVKDGEKPRTYRRKARRDYMRFAKKRKKTRKEIRKSIKTQLQYIRRDLEIIEKYLEKGKVLSPKHIERLLTIKTVYEQQLTMYTERKRSIDNRIVSLGQPWVRPIVRGKAKSKCEFGAKVEISVSNGYVRLEKTSFNAYNESTSLVEIIERYRLREGQYPKKVLVDNIYRTRANLVFCKKHAIQVTGKPLGRPRKDAIIDKKRIREDEINRIEVERQFSHAKGSFGLGLIKTRLKETSETAIALSIVALNLSHIGRIFRTLFWWFNFRSAFSVCQRKFAIIH